MAQRLENLNGIQLNGIMYAFATLGPAMGYIIGGQFLDIYVDFDTVDSADVRITPDDLRWVGAWWVGFVIASGLFLLSAIPISAYGSELPNAKQVRETRVSEMHDDDGSMPTGLSSETRKLSDLKYMPSRMWQLLTTLPFMFVTFAGASEGMITSDFATFMPIFIQNQFGVTAGWVSMLTGTVPGPILFGAIIDSTCTIWREKKRRACLLLDDLMSRIFFILVVCFKIVSIYLFILAHQLYKPPAEKIVQYVVDLSENVLSETSGVTISPRDDEESPS